MHICFGYGIVFSVDLHAEVGVSDETLKEKAIEHFKKYMPTTEQVLKVDEYLSSDKAWISVEHETL